MSYTSSYAVRIDGRKEDAAVRQVVAKEAIVRTQKAVCNQLMPVLVAVCLADQSARDYALARHDPSNTGIVVLRLALDNLHDVYARGR